jgi:hypothetical protein
MVAIRITPNLISPMVLQDGGKTGRDIVSTAHPIGSTDVTVSYSKWKLSSSSALPRRYCKISNQSHLYTIKEESEDQINHEGEESFNLHAEVSVFQILSSKVPRSKRSLQSGLSSLVLSSEKTFDTTLVSSANTSEGVSQTNEEQPSEDPCFSWGLCIDEDE